MKTLSAAQTEFLAKVTKWDSLLVAISNKKEIITADCLAREGLLVKSAESRLFIRYSIPTAPEAQPAADEIELEAPTDATLGDTLYERECACGQLLNSDKETICPTCKVHGGRPLTRLIHRQDGGVMVLHTGEIERYENQQAESVTPVEKRYEAEVVGVLSDRVLIRSKEFGETIRIGEGEMLIPFLITGDKVTFECNLDWFHNPRAVNVKRIVEIEPESTGPAPTMMSDLIKAKDEHIARLEARIKELEAQVKRLKSTLDLESGYAEFLENK